MKNLFTVKSSECTFLLSKLHTSKLYNKIGKRFCFSNCTMTASEANLPTLAKILFAARKKAPFGLINGTFKFVSSQSHNENTQVSDFVNPVKLPAIQCAYSWTNLLMPGTSPINVGLHCVSNKQPFTARPVSASAITWLNTVRFL